MPMTNYSTIAEGQLPGSIADLAPHVIVSRFNQLTTPIAYGLGVVRGVGDFDNVALPSALTSVFEGVCVRNNRFEDALGVPAKKQFDVLRQGHIVVPVEEAVTINDPAYLRVIVTATANPWTVLGAFRKSQDGASPNQTCILIPSARFLQLIAADRAVLEISLP